MRILVEILIKTLLGGIFSISFASFWLLRFEVEALIEQECSIAALNPSTPETPTPEFTVSSRVQPQPRCFAMGNSLAIASTANQFRMKEPPLGSSRSS